MLLGLVATSDIMEEYFFGLASAAHKRGWQCQGFLTDLGVKLLDSARVLELAQSGALQLGVCIHSWEIHGGTAAPAGVVMGSQYLNAKLAHVCDRVIVL
jgi:hypothetical protein